MDGLPFGWIKGMNKARMRLGEGRNRENFEALPSPTKAIRKFEGFGAGVCLFNSALIHILFSH